MTKKSTRSKSTLGSFGFENYTVKFKNIKARDCEGGCNGKYIPTAKSPKMCIKCLVRKMEELKKAGKI